MYKFLEETVDSYMTRNVTTVRRDHDLLALSEMFARDDFNSYPVEDDGQVVGIVTKFDILKCFAFTPSQMLPRYHDLMSRKIGDVMTPEFIYVSPDTRLTRVLQIMVEHRIRSIIVLDGTQKDITAYPLRATIEELKGLPDALFIFDDDILRDDGEAYAAKLSQAGVRVTSVRYNGTVHDFAMLNPLADTPAVRGAVLQIIATLKEVLS